MNTKNKKLAEGRLARIEFTKEKTRALRIENDLKENSMCPQSAPSEKKQDEPSTKMPELGVMPENIWKLKRLDDLKSAIIRRLKNVDSIDPDWAEEYNRLLIELAPESQWGKKSHKYTLGGGMAEFISCMKRVNKCPG